MPGIAPVAGGFWSGLVLQAFAGIGWAGAYMRGLKAIAAHAAGVGIAGASSYAVGA